MSHLSLWCNTEDTFDQVRLQAIDIFDFETWYGKLYYCNKMILKKKVIFNFYLTIDIKVVFMHYINANDVPPIKGNELEYSCKAWMRFYKFAQEKNFKLNHVTKY